MARYGRERRGLAVPVRVSAAIGVVLALAFIVAQTVPGIRNSTDDARTGVDDGIVTVSNASPLDFVGRFQSMWSAQKELEELRIENSQLALWRDVATSMARRVEHYEALLDLVGEPIPVGVSARVVTETNGPFAETRLANAGQVHGVQSGAIAVNSAGLVGQVIRVGRQSARILLVSDYNSRVPVMGDVSGVRAILAGGRGDTVGQLIDRPESDEFIAGETLITTGEGGVYPPGLRAGQVVSIDRQSVVRLPLADGPLEFVRLLPPQQILRPEDDPAIEPATAAAEGAPSGVQ